MHSKTQYLAFVFLSAVIWLISGIKTLTDSHDLSYWVTIVSALVALWLLKTNEKDKANDQSHDDLNV
ncbi:hypothetical protein [Thermococcus sp.]|uniref:hypothetical protein n=1 Tax=Thermococcus sp. TaxID=35749 RepID=UPI00199FAC99|nr:hypothetical protein [Thermococcus sp.]MBC7095444.1 hypothetical protein [Thermococcus sp.]